MTASSKTVSRITGRIPPGNKKAIKLKGKGLAKAKAQPQPKAQAKAKAKAKAKVKAGPPPLPIPAAGEAPILQEVAAAPAVIIAEAPASQINAEPKNP
uniref:Uncharacterized protein n=1 Tax=Chromera velia CCMP2878 TaxID=1169474 RepID=A0A0G4FW86_9ALVE|eukprot:Cvel_19062.t1-p1 / transcript=Cvel_19062.t1 / gene=Cvel_19062 / organism=Chromera_velia_CCMP2878 / gene_product=hypothetical protein / transcript_product=hypothetical protein / location=Cvel_scaffold1617:24618-24908(-) / protein_length=97 / sequence_SO=supercontig / SO=protein_coding / is_pseudo=false